MFEVSGKIVDNLEGVLNTERHQESVSLPSEAFVKLRVWTAGSRRLPNYGQSKLSPCLPGLNYTRSSHQNLCWSSRLGGALAGLLCALTCCALGALCVIGALRALGAKRKRVPLLCGAGAALGGAGAGAGRTIGATGAGVSGGAVHAAAAAGAAAGGAGGRRRPPARSACKAFKAGGASGVSGKSTCSCGGWYGTSSPWTGSANLGSWQVKSNAPKSNGLHPSSHGLQPSSNGCRVLGHSLAVE